MKMIVVYVLAGCLQLAAWGGESPPVVPVPLIAEPPVSSGVNQGFSRQPASPYCNDEKGIIVVESIAPTVRMSSRGNNAQFSITEWRPDNDRGLLTVTKRCVFEGTSRVTNEETIVAKKVAPNIYLYPDADGASRVYVVEVDSRGRILRLTAFFYERGDKLVGTSVIYQR